jgi:hypothetical protein
MIGQPEMRSDVGFETERIELSGKRQLRQVEHECLRANLTKSSEMHD